MDIHARDDIHLGFLGLCFASLDEIRGMNNFHQPTLLRLCAQRLPELIHFIFIMIGSIS